MSEEVQMRQAVYLATLDAHTEIDKLKAELAQTNATLETFKEADTKWRELYESVGRENAALKELVREAIAVTKFYEIADLNGDWLTRANDATKE